MTARHVDRSTIALAPGVTADVAITAAGAVTLTIVGGELTLTAERACVLGMALVEASRIAGQRAVKLLRPRAKHEVRSSFNAVVFGVGGVSVGTEPETTLLPTRKK